MNISRLQTLAFRATVLGALIAVSGSAAMAQRAKPAGPPVTTKGADKSNPRADKGQATAEASRVAARDRKSAKSAFKAARHESKSLLRGIGFTSMEKRMNRDITKRYDHEYKTLEKANKDALKADSPDASILGKINALRLQERAELRSAMTPEQRVRFDINISRLDAS